MNLPFVISLPHCWGLVPAYLLPSLALDTNEVMEAVDLGTMELFGELPVQAVICAQVSRLVVDLNRGLHQRDVKGLIALKDYHGRPVYRHGMVPSHEEIQARVERYYVPYHKMLEETLKREDVVGLLDCHSLNGVGPPEAPDAGKKRKDIVLGNNGDSNGRRKPGTRPLTCPEDIMLAMASEFREEGFSVSMNDPYPGGFITTHYGRILREKRKFAVQVEINQDLYIARDRPRCDPHKLFDVRRRIKSALSKIAAISCPRQLTR